MFTSKLLLYGVFGFFVVLIINWLLNEEKNITWPTLTLTPIIEGVENKTAEAPKCPEDCTSVKELQKKLSDSVKKVQTLEQTIIENTITSQAHAKSISDLNESLNEMQKNQKDE
jgi:hypothetical protein